MCFIFKPLFYCLFFSNQIEKMSYFDNIAEISSTIMSIQTFFCLRPQHIQEFVVKKKKDIK